MSQFAIPHLPANSINDTEEFYTALGFIVTYKQKAPNNFISMNFEGIEIQFFGLKALKPEENFSSCYLIVTDIDKKYDAFRAGLKKLYGKYPIKGIPRIGALKDIPAYGVRQFIVVDPTGNYIRIGQLIPKTDSVIYAENNVDKTLDPNATQIQKAYEAATRLIEGKHDYEAAAKVLDTTIKIAKDPEPLEIFNVLLLRSEVAVKLGDYNAASQFLEKTKQQLETLDKEELKDEVRLISELEEAFSEAA